MLCCYYCKLARRRFFLSAVLLAFLLPETLWINSLMIHQYPLSRNAQVHIRYVSVRAYAEFLAHPIMYVLQLFIVYNKIKYCNIIQ